MMYHIPGVLSSQDVARFREHLEQAKWVDGHATTGVQGTQVKNNQQVGTRSALYVALRNRALNVVNQHTLLFVVALPCTLSMPPFNRYQNNETRGFRVDGAICSYPRNSWMRAGLSATLSLSNPESYDDDELAVNDTFGQHRIELPAGDLVLYLSSSLHCMTSVTRGVRMAPFTWIQSMIHDDKKRTMLSELNNNIQSLKGHYSESEEILLLLDPHHNLLRERSET